MAAKVNFHGPIMDVRRVFVMYNGVPTLVKSAYILVGGQSFRWLGSDRPAAPYPAGEYDAVNINAGNYDALNVNAENYDNYGQLYIP